MWYKMSYFGHHSPQITLYYDSTEDHLNHITNFPTHLYPINQILRRTRFENELSAPPLKCSVVQFNRNTRWRNCRTGQWRTGQRTKLQTDTEVLDYDGPDTDRRVFQSYSKATYHDQCIKVDWSRYPTDLILDVLNDARINACLSMFDNGSYTRIQFLHALRPHGGIAGAKDSDSSSITRTTPSSRRW